MNYTGDISSASDEIYSFLKHYFPYKDHALFEPGDVDPKTLTNPNYKGDVFLLVTEANFNKAIKTDFRKMLYRHGLCVKKAKKVKELNNILIVTCPQEGVDVEYKTLMPETYYGIVGRNKGGIEYYEAPREIAAKDRSKLNG